MLKKSVPAVSSFFFRPPTPTWLHVCGGVIWIKQTAADVSSASSSCGGTSQRSHSRLYCCGWTPAFLCVFCFSQCDGPLAGPKALCLCAAAEASLADGKIWHLASLLCWINFKLLLRHCFPFFSQSLFISHRPAVTSTCTIKTKPLKRLFT